MVVAVETFLHTLLPFGVFSAIGIDDELAVHEGLESFRGEVATASGGEPEVVGIAAGADESCLFAFDDADDAIGVACD